LSIGDRLDAGYPLDSSDSAVIVFISIIRSIISGDAILLTDISTEQGYTTTL